MVRTTVTSNKHTEGQKNEDNSTTSAGSSSNTGTSRPSHSKHVLQDMALQKLRDNVKEIQQDVVRRVHDELDTMVHDILSAVEKSPALADNVNNLFNQSSQENNCNNHTQSHGTGKKRAAAREFIPRPSLLTELFEVKHIRSIYHMFIAVLIIAFLSNIANDVLSGAEVRLGLRYVHIAFGRFGWVLTLWTCMFSATLAVYPVYCVWAGYRHTHTRLWDTLASLLLAVYVCAFAALPPYMKGYDMPVASAAVVMLEQIRLLMKLHAYIRSQTPHVLHNTGKPLPAFHRFLYFLFAPVLVYRDTYPRTQCIRWRFVAVRMLEILGAILLMSFIVEHYMVPEFSGFGVRRHTWSSLAASVFRTMLPASMMMLCSFYLMLHSWLNGWAEMLRFADRQFYRDWWNAASFGEYFRTWNIVVHDYLYEYVYRDVYAGGRVLATLLVFTVSALVHEYIIGFMLGFCYPVLFVQFIGIGMVLGFIKYNSDAGNVFLWLSLASGNGILISCYSMELFARVNCPPTYDTWLDLFVPRSWTCHGLV